ncbi:MAG TPA: UrcA family protein [Rhizomicrobium sp.]|jgi:UrcA family protein
MKLFHIPLSLLVLTPVAAFAQQASSSVVVSYGDLDLGSQAGVKVLDRRLASAIRSVCGEHEGTAIPERRFAAERCVREKSAEVAVLRDRAIASYSSSKALASR